MSDALVELGLQGSQKIITAALCALDAVCAGKDKDIPLAFPDTNYYLPFIGALSGLEIKSAHDARQVIQWADDLCKGIPTPNGLSSSGLGGILNKGIAALLCEEVLAAVEVLKGAHPQPGCSGFIPDKILRSLGLQLVDGRISGIAVILGPASDEDKALQLIRSFQSKSIVCLLAGASNGMTLSGQLQRKGIHPGLENYVVALGEDYLSAIYAVNLAVRAPLMYGGFKPGQWKGIMEYMRNRVPVFVLVLGHVDDVIVATGLGALALGFPIITDVDVPQMGKIETTLYEAITTEKDYAKIPSRCILTRGIKAKVAQIDVPVSYAAAFEGERVRREQLHVEFGGKSATAFELLTVKNEKDIEDGAVRIVGDDIDTVPAGAPALSLGVIVEVFGRKMQKDFEPILERQIHRFINYALGLMHAGQRDMLWIRISKDAFAKGFRLKHLGVIIHAMVHSEYSAIVDKVQVSLVTDPQEVKRLLSQARHIYDERDERIGGMTDESVDTYYSCLLCQSFAPNHVCVVTPERLGLCGAYSWLDAKASYEITPTGPNRPIEKGACLDARLGQWENVNAFVMQAANKTIERVSMYSLMDSPQTSCGCFECIIAIIPEVNGVMAVHRDYPGMTPSGMSFTTLAGSVGGGVQTPGFLGVGKLYLTSRKFISAEGGLRRLVWMPKDLKELLRDKLLKCAREIGEPDLIDKIADESTAVTSEELAAYLEKVRHPVLRMPPIL